MYRTSSAWTGSNTVPAELRAIRSKSSSTIATASTGRGRFHPEGHSAVDARRHRRAVEAQPFAAEWFHGDRLQDGPGAIRRRYLDARVRRVGATVVQQHHGLPAILGIDVVHLHPVEPAAASPFRPLGPGTGERGASAQAARFGTMLDQVTRLMVGTTEDVRAHADPGGGLAALLDQGRDFDRPSPPAGRPKRPANLAATMTLNQWPRRPAWHGRSYTPPDHSRHKARQRQPPTSRHARTRPCECGNRPRCATDETSATSHHWRIFRMKAHIRIAPFKSKAQRNTRLADGNQLCCSFDRYRGRKFTMRARNWVLRLANREGAELPLCVVTCDARPRFMPGACGSNGDGCSRIRRACRDAR